MVAIADFDPQKVNLAWGVNATGATNEFVPPTTFDAQAVDHASIGITAAQGRADTTGRISGLAAQTRGPQTSLAPQGEVTVPMRLGLYEMRLLAFLSEFHQTPVQSGSDTTFQWVIDPAQTDVDVSDRRLFGIYDKRDGHPKLVGPTVIQAINFEFNAGEPAMMTYAPLFLGWNYYAPPVVTAGSAAIPIQTTGWLNATNRAIDPRNLEIEVTAFATPLITATAFLGGGPAGAVTFSFNGGLNEESRPIFGEVLDSEGLPAGVPIGRAELPFYAFAPDLTGIVVADTYTYESPITPPARVVPIDPEIPTAAICVEIDGVQIAGIATMNINIVNTFQLVDGGAWGLFPRAFQKIGVTQVTGTISRKNITYKNQGDLRDNATFRILVQGRSDTLVDPGGSEGDQYKFDLDLDECFFPDGTTFKDFAGGNADDGLEIPFTAASSTNLGGASYRWTINSPVAAIAP